MALLLLPLSRQSTGWRERFQAEMPELDLRIWPETGDRVDIDVVACPGLPPGEFATLPNLKLVIGLLAGSERLLGDPALPSEIPMIRVGDPDGDAMMNEAALLHVLRHHRNLPAYQLAQQRSEWLSLPVLRPRERRVGVMGLGPIGLAAARTLADYGFNVAGWVRRPRNVAGVEVFSGRDRLSAFLARSEIVVNLLPLTPETQGILCRETFAQMPRGASVINLGRGGHIVDADLTAALDEGQLAAATLDVFTVEPLPKESPLWRHPQITITPHCARRIDALDLVPRICAAIRRLHAGQPQEQLVDRVLGY
jgi:glyoxylate/hydroxypyruvate reductase A